MSTVEPVKAVFNTISCGETFLQSRAVIFLIGQLKFEESLVIKSRYNETFLNFPQFAENVICIQFRTNQKNQSDALPTSFLKTTCTLNDRLRQHSTSAVHTLTVSGRKLGQQLTNILGKGCD